MGGVAVSQPQDVLRNRSSNKVHRIPRNTVEKQFNRKSPNSKDPDSKNSGTKVVVSKSPEACFVDSTNSQRRRRSPQKTAHRTISPVKKSGGLVMGQVKILKRGESLADVTKTKADKEIRGKENVESLAKVDKEAKGKENVESPAKVVEMENWMVLSSTKRLGPEPDIKGKENVESPANVAEMDNLMVLSSTKRLGPEPELVPKQNLYAGSGFVVSPPPSSLPQPKFCKKEADSAVDLMSLLGFRFGLN